MTTQAWEMHPTLKVFALAMILAFFGCVIAHESGMGDQFRVYALRTLGLFFLLSFYVWISTKLHGEKLSPAAITAAHDTLEQPLLMLSDKDEFTLRDLYQHVLVTGGTGAGKTSGPGQALATAVLNHGASVLVLTQKPDEVDRWKGYAQKTAREILLFGPGHDTRLNPFEYVASKGEVIGSTESMMGLFQSMQEVTKLEKGGKSDNPFWPNKANQFTSNGIDLLKAAQEPVTLANVQQCVTTAPQSREEAGSESWQASSYCASLIARSNDLRNQMSEQQYHDAQMAWQFWLTEVPGMAQETRGSVVSNVTVMTSPLLRGQLYQLLGTTTNFTPEDWLEEKILVLDMPVSVHGRAGLLAQTIISHVFMDAIERRKGGNPALIFIDEFQRFATKRLMEFMQTSRSANAGCVLLTQTVNNVRAAMGGEDGGKTAADALLDLSATKIFCANSGETNEWAANQIGKSLQDFSTWGANPDEDRKKMHSNVGGSERFEQAIQPAYFARLKKGGPPDFQVGAIVHQFGRQFSTTGLPFIEVSFPQK